MQFLRTGSRQTAARELTIELTSTNAWGRVATLVGALIFLTSAISLYAQRRTATTSLELRVRPEELLRVQNDSLVLKIRLAPGTIASIWAANSCTSPAPQSRVISASGTYTLPLHALMSMLSNPTSSATQVCLASSDGVLNDSVPLGILATGNGAAVHGETPQLAPNGVSIVAPDGWAVTTPAGTTTWSNP